MLPVCNLGTSSLYPASRTKPETGRGTTKADCPSGQWERTVNPSAYAYAGSNPASATQVRPPFEGACLVSVGLRVGRLAGVVRSLASACRVRYRPLAGSVGGPPAETLDFKAVVRFCVFFGPLERGAFAPEPSDRHHATVRAVHEHIPTNFHRTPRCRQCLRDSNSILARRYWFPSNPRQVLRDATALGKPGIRLCAGRICPLARELMPGSRPA